MATSSAAALAVTDRLHWEELPNGLTVVGDITRGRLPCGPRMWAGLLRLEPLGRKKSDFATEDGPLRAKFNMSRVRRKGQMYRQNEGLV